MMTTTISTEPRDGGLTDDDLRRQFVEEHPEMDDPARTDAREFERAFRAWLEWERGGCGE